MMQHTNDIFLSLFMSLLSLIVGGSLMMIAHALRKHSKHVQENEKFLKMVDIPSNSLFRIFHRHLLSMKEIDTERGYSSVLAIVQIMIGIRPTCDMVLEIWPPAFECYNIIAPNFLNLPVSLFQTKFIQYTALAMYASSRANQCGYCSSHSCSLAVRRGVDPSVMKQLLLLLDERQHLNSGTRKRAAVVKFAYGLGTVPCSLTTAHVEEIYKHFSPVQVEWLVAAVAMFGSFNKLLDGLGIPLEISTYRETIGIMDSDYKTNIAGSVLEATSNSSRSDIGDDKAPMATAPLLPPPPTDDWTCFVKILYEGLRPGDGALALDKRLQASTPYTTNACMNHLREKVGYDFPFLQALHNGRFMRAITSVILKIFCPEERFAGIGLEQKLNAGIVYTEILKNEELEDVLNKIQGHKCNDTMMRNDDENDAMISFNTLIMKIAKAVSYTPSRVTTSLVDEIVNQHKNPSSLSVSPPMVVELVSFLSCLQMIHRIMKFYKLKEEVVCNGNSLFGGKNK